MGKLSEHSISPNGTEIFYGHNRKRYCIGNDVCRYVIQLYIILLESTHMLIGVITQAYWMLRVSNRKIDKISAAQNITMNIGMFDSCSNP